MFVGHSYSSLSDYKKCPWGIPETENIDELSFWLLRESHRQYSKIVADDGLCLLWGRTLGRLDLSHEVFQREVSWESEGAFDWPFKRQSLRVLVKKFNNLLSPNKNSSEANPPELDAVIRVCRISRLFFNGPSHRLDFLFSEMVSIPMEELRPFQAAPHPGMPENALACPPKSCWSHGDHWSHDDWPENHWFSFDHIYSIMQGLIPPKGATIPAYGRVIASSEYSIPILWGLSRLARNLFFPNSGVYVERTWSELYADESEYNKGTPMTHPIRGVADTSNPRVIANLIRMGIPPFLVIDFSQCVLGERTQWKEGEKSEFFVFLLFFVCKSGTREELEALIEDPEPLRSYYASLQDFSETPYKRALNNPCPSVLIPLLKEAALHPLGALAKEIQEDVLEMPRENSDYLRLWSSEENRQRCPRSHLILACETGDLELAKYLISEKEKEAERESSLESDESNRIIRAAEIVSSFVNQPNPFKSPPEMPMDIAVRKGHTELVKFLRDKGAQASADLELQMEGKLSDQMEDILKRSRMEREKLCQELVAQGYKFVVTGQLVGQLKRIDTRYRECLSEIKKQAEVNASLQKSFEGELDEFERDIEEKKYLNQQLTLLQEHFENARKLVLSKNFNQDSVYVY